MAFIEGVEAVEEPPQHFWALHPVPKDAEKCHCTGIVIIKGGRALLKGEQVSGGFFGVPPGLVRILTRFGPLGDCSPVNKGAGRVFRLLWLVKLRKKISYTSIFSSSFSLSL